MVYYPMTPWTGLAEWKNIKGKPYITVSAKGIANGLSDIPNDGADFGPDTPGTQTNGIMEAKNALPKIVNPQTGREVPVGTIVIKFGGYPIQISSHIILYDDEFITLTSPDSWHTTFGVPTTLTNAGGYITNTTNTSILQILKNPANINLGMGTINLESLTFINTYSTSSNSFPILYMGPNKYSTGYNANENTDPEPSVIYLDKINILDNIGNQPLLYLATPGFEQLFRFGDIALYGNSGAYNMATIAASHITADYIYILSNSTIALPTQNYTGFMLMLQVGQNCHIGTYHFNFSGNGVLFATGLGYQTSAMTVIDVIRDEMAVVNYGLDQNGYHVTAGTQTGVIINYYSDGTGTGTPNGMSKLAPDSNFFLIKNFPQFRGDGNPNNIFLQPSTPSVPASGTAVTNTNQYPVKVYINGGAITQIQITINGTAYTVYNNSTASAVYESFTLPAAASITLTYTTAPTWVWLPE